MRYQQYPIKDIGQFFPNLLPMLKGVIEGLIIVPPLKVLSNLCCFQNQRKREVFRVVKLLPVSLIPKFYDLLRQFLSSHI